jgi:hypothetical protein
LLVSKLKEPSLKAKNKINMEDANSIVRSIAKLLERESAKVNEEYENIQKLQMTTSKVTVSDNFQSDDVEG